MREERAYDYLRNDSRLAEPLQTVMDSSCGEIDYG